MNVWRLPPTVQSYVHRIRTSPSFVTGVGSYVDKGNRLINRLTGYDQCERLRESVNLADAQFQQLRERLQDSRLNFTKAIAERSICQKELNGLLQRKPSWLDTDLQRFTELYRAEMKLETTEISAKEVNERLEKEVDQAHHKLVGAMRERYQEEQLWSDKIRRASTFGTFGLMLINVMLFMGVQLISEPRKRHQLVSQIESVVMERLEQSRPSSSVVVRPLDPKASLYQQMLTGAAALLLMNALLIYNFK